MSENNSGADRVMRSEERIPRLRARGRANRQKLLSTAETLLAQPDSDNLRFSDIFEAAGVSRGSAYRIYIGLDDLMHDLAAEWINNFVDYLASSRPETPPEDWMTLSDFIVEHGVAYWRNTADTLRVMPRIRSNLPESHKRAQRALSRIIGEIFGRYFALPNIDEWPAVLGFFVQICDMTCSDAVRREGEISDERLAEAQALCRTYLSFYLPAWLPHRSDQDRLRA
ncbi:MAG: TetR/AcrR family transcriptional regulator [Pseudomonadota bacterium]